MVVAIKGAANSSELAADNGVRLRPTKKMIIDTAWTMPRVACSLNRLVLRVRGLNHQTNGSIRNKPKSERKKAISTGEMVCERPRMIAFMLAKHAVAASTQICPANGPCGNHRGSDGRNGGAASLSAAAALTSV